MTETAAQLVAARCCIAGGGPAGMMLGLLLARSGVDVVVRLSRMPGDSDEQMGRFGTGHIFIMINRGDYWQCGFVIRKNSIDAVRAQGRDAFRASVTNAAPFVSGRVSELRDWNDIKLLTVAVDRMPRWYRGGLLFIGDAAQNPC